MTKTTAQPPTPAFDVTRLRGLARDVDDQKFASVFASRYREMLTGRISRIHATLMAADVEGALDAALSLKVSSATVGTCELASLALVIEGDVRRADVLAARAAAADLMAAAARADEALAAYLGTALSA